MQSVIRSFGLVLIPISVSTFAQSVDPDETASSGETEESGVTETDARGGPTAANQASTIDELIALVRGETPSGNNSGTTDEVESESVTTNELEEPSSPE